MNRKGISPLIAAVLLIAFTMAVASLFAQWAPQLMQDVQGDTSEQAEDISDNSDLVLEISNVGVDGTTPEADIQQIAGEISAGEVVVTFHGNDSSVVQGDGTLADDSTRDIITVTAEDDFNTDEIVERVEADPSTDRQGAPSATWRN